MHNLACLMKLVLREASPGSPFRERFAELLASLDRKINGHDPGIGVVIDPDSLAAWRSALGTAMSDSRG